ncbi:MAG: metallophosphoesterase [Lachnospiraceae bacterium]|nr:metallophosphoesterase [Lachnospiraceae bacterium]
MRILAVADVEEPILWDYFDRDYVKDVDLILSAGDLKKSYLEFLVTMANCPLLYVHGNHDSRYQNDPPEGCICIEEKVFDFHGLRILGLGGSMRYKEGPYMYNESEMERRILKTTPAIAMKNGFDILLAHSPIRGFGDLNDLPHVGYSCFSTLLMRWKPKLMLHGHVHKSYGHFKAEREHPSGARILNVCGHMFIDIPEGSYPGEGKTGSPLYDLYIALQKRKMK